MTLTPISMRPMGERGEERERARLGGRGRRLQKVPVRKDSEQKDLMIGLTCAEGPRGQGCEDAGGDRRGGRGRVRRWRQGQGWGHWGSRDPARGE